MPEIDDGGPAFGETDWEGSGYSGMSLRDYFAAAALTGIHAAQIHGLNADFAKHFSGLAYQQADAMLKARKP